MVCNSTEATWHLQLDPMNEEHKHEPPKPAKCHKQGGNNQNESDIIARVTAVQAENQ